MCPTIPSSRINVASSTFKNFQSLFGNNHRKHETFPLIWDSGASVCVSPCREDFVDYTTEVTIPSLSGYAKGKDDKVIGEGHVLWAIEDEKGMLRTLKLHACHLPSSKHRLIATNTVTASYKPETFTISSTGGRLSGVPDDNSRGSIFAPLNIASKLLISIGRSFHGSCSTAPVQRSRINAATSSHLSNNNNLSGAEKELLNWHEKLGHIAFAKVQFLLRSGVLATSDAARRLHRSAASLSPLKCAACLYAKQRTRSIPGRTSHAIVQSRSGVLKKNNLLPGQEVSVDHFICSQKGRLFTSRGKSSDKDMFAGGCIFADHASNYLHVEFQSSMSTHATLTSKLNYENICRDHGVYPQRYLSDNGTAFSSKKFTEHLRTFEQTTRFAGVGAHHHNGHVERSIQTIMSISRAMMIHASLHWPDMADSCLWPMTVQHAVFLWNHMPDPTTGLSPHDIFTKTHWNQAKFHDIHVWGCPVYVLDKKIADGNKIPRWKPRSHRCVYLGSAPSYASSVPLVLNPTTGAITPQFHVVFDDYFHTVNSDPANLPDYNSDEWFKMFGDSTYQYVYDDDDLLAMRELTDELDDAEDHVRAARLQDRVLDAAERVRPSQPLSIPSLSPSPRPSPTWRESLTTDVRPTRNTEPARGTTSSQISPQPSSQSTIPPSSSSSTPLPTSSSSKSSLDSSTSISDSAKLSKNTPTSLDTTNSTSTTDNPTISLRRSTYEIRCKGCNRKIKCNVKKCLRKHCDSFRILLSFMWCKFNSYCCES